MEDKTTLETQLNAWKRVNDQLTAKVKAIETLNRFLATFSPCSTEEAIYYTELLEHLYERNNLISKDIEKLLTCLTQLLSADTYDTYQNGETSTSDHLTS